MAATVDSSFADNFASAQKNGIIRGAIHIGLPGSPTDGAAQANFFITNGGLCILMYTFCFSSHYLMQAGGLVTGARSREPSVFKVPPPLS
jgi:hypothetical protein